MPRVKEIKPDILPAKVQRKKEFCTKIHLDEELLYRLCQSMLSLRSIGVIMGCSEDTIQDNYRKVVDKGRENRRYSLVEAMWSKALDEKDTKMQIWLSKQHLGYKDTIPEAASQVIFNVICNEIPG